MSHNLTVPVELLEYAHTHKLHKATGVFLILKSSCDGHLVLTDDVIKSTMCKAGIKDYRSFRKYLNQLSHHNWLGLDPKTNVCYVRGFAWLRKKYNLMSSMAVIFDAGRDSGHATEFIHAALICKELLRIGRARKARIIKLAGSSALRKESAIQELAAGKLISPHVGLSLSRLRKILGVSQTQADRIKTKLVELGYITAKAKYREVMTADAPDWAAVKFLPQNRRYDVKKKIRAGKVIYVWRERTFDEIGSRLDFKRQKVAVRNLTGGRRGKP